MTKEDLSKFMSFNKEGRHVRPLEVFSVNGSFMVGVYQGSISPYDILIKYRQKTVDKWSRIRTPKHIHWAVDILIKMHADKASTKNFLDFLLGIWANTKPIKSAEERKSYLNIESLIEVNRKEIGHYEDLGKRGEYSINFLVLLAKLLMIQEKTNLKTAYMFKNLLEALRSGEDIFKIVSIATHNRR